MILATLATPNFDFAVVAESQTRANAALHDAWRKHASLTGADPDYFFDFAREDVHYVEVELGDVVRDGSVLLRRKGSR